MSMSKRRINISGNILARKIATRLNQLKGKSENTLDNKYFERVSVSKMEEDEDINSKIEKFIFDRFGGYVIAFQTLFIDNKELEKVSIPDEICLLFEDLYVEIEERRKKVVSYKIDNDNLYFDEETYEILNGITYCNGSVYDTPLPTIINLYIHYAEEDKMDEASAMSRALSDLYLFYYETSIMDITDISLKYLNQILKIKYPEKKCIQDYDFTKIKEVFDEIKKEV